MADDRSIQIDLDHIPLAAALVNASCVIRANLQFGQLRLDPSQDLSKRVLENLTALETVSTWSSVTLNDVVVHVLVSRVSDATWLLLVQPPRGAENVRLLREVFHDIRSPLAVIFGQAGLLERDKDLGKGHQAAARDILWSASQVDSVVARVADLLRCTADSSLIQDDLSSLAQLGQWVHTKLSRMQPEQAVDIEVIDDPQATWRGDLSRMSEAVAQLVIHATPKSEAWAKVRIGVFERDGSRRMEVEIRSAGGALKKHAEWHYAHAMAQILGAEVVEQAAEPAIRLLLPVRREVIRQIPAVLIDAMKKVPEDLRSDLVAAIGECDMDRAGRAIASINTLDPSLGAYLAELATEFDYDGLEQACGLRGSG